MTKEQLLKQLKDIPDNPDNAEIYVESDHGQNGNMMDRFYVTTDYGLDYFSEDMNWEKIEDVDVDKITAIVLL